MLRFLLTLLAAMLPLIAILAGPHRAAACSLIAIADLPERLRRQTDAAHLIILGEVREERALAATPGTSQDTYASTIQPAVVLKGQTPDGNIELAPLGFLGADCSGGPRLRAGERVLLFLDDDKPISSGLSILLLGPGKYLLRPDGSAAVEHFAGELEPAGASSELVQQVAALAGASPELTVQALQFAAGSNGTTEAASGPDGSTAVALAASLSILLAGLGAGLVVRLRS